MYQSQFGDTESICENKDFFFQITDNYNFKDDVNTNQSINL